MATSQGSPFLKLLDSTRHSDFEIECQGNVFKVHKALLAAKSDFFDRLCDSKFLEGNTNKVKLDDEDPGTVFRMILFIYGDTYSTEPLPDDAPGHGQFNIKDGCVLTFDEVNPQARCYFDTFYHRVVFELRPSQAWKVDWLRRAILHAFMFRIGDKYDIHGLKTYSSRKFLLAYSHFDCSIFENKAASLLNVHRDWHPKHFAKPLRRLSSLIIKLVYEKTPPHSSEIKDALVWDYKLSNESENPINAMITEDMVKTKEDVPEFGADIEDTKVSNRLWDCSQCHRDAKMVTRRCGCGHMDDCTKESCLLEMTRQSICFACFRFGTLQMVPEVGASKQVVENLDRPRLRF